MFVGKEWTLFSLAISCRPRIIGLAATKTDLICSVDHGREAPMDDRVGYVIGTVNDELEKLKGQLAPSAGPDAPLAAYLRYALNLGASLTRSDMSAIQRGKVFDAAISQLVSHCRDAVTEPLKARIRYHGSVELAELAEDFDRRVTAMKDSKAEPRGKALARPRPVRA
jgi:hypothetical protein